MSKIILTDEEIKKIAGLARLSQNLTQAEIDNYREKLSPIISIAQELNQIDTSLLATTDGWRTFTLEDLRKDEPTPDNNQNENYQRIRQNIITNWTTRVNPKNPIAASPKYGNLLVLPGIFSES
jgi:aspartyl/glutamyl-tRNA(Asn/Gln) amidotransferase C subunit